jgi:hypothetical protein
MPKLFRRTWERQRYGRAGALSSPLPARTGTDAVISGASFAAPVKVLTSATAAFVSGDVGRKIRLIGTPSGRYDGMYVIDAINSGTSVNLRMNHNVGGTPTSDAKFYENGTTISWKICESCTFTADAAGDIEDFYPGSYIYIDSGNTANRGLWLISHRVDSQTCFLSKSYIMFIIDNNPVNWYTIEATQDFQAQSGLKWYVIDRQPIAIADMAELLQQFMIDAGWSMLQQRGTNTTLQSYKDVILKSTGEPDALIPGGKAMYYRMALCGVRTTTNTANSNGVVFGHAVFQHWDPTLTAVAPGAGGGGLKGSTSTIDINTAGTTGGQALGSGNNPSWSTGPWRTSANSVDYTQRGRNELPHEVQFWDYNFFGDRDEVFLGGHMYGPGYNAQNYFRGLISHLKVMGPNPNIVTAINNITAGTNKDVNVGTVDVTTLTPPYAVGDNITLVGRKSSAPKEYVETTTIVSFNNTDPNNRLIRVANVSMAFGNGPDTLKLQVGEDPFPVVMAFGTNNTIAPILHNLSKAAFSPGRDYDESSAGSASTLFEVWSGGFGEIDPNRKTGRYGVVALGVRNTTSGEFRGRFRHCWEIPDYRWSLGAKLVANAGSDVYVAVSPTAGGIAQAVGPMSRFMAGIYS